MKLGRTDEIRITISRPITEASSYKVVMMLDKDGKQYSKKVSFDSISEGNEIDEILQHTIGMMLSNYDNELKSSKPRITLYDNTMEIVTKMSDGNPGAINFIMSTIMEDNMNLIEVILPLDTLGIYGSKIYMLWNDACYRDLSKVKKVLEAWRTSKLTKEAIHENLNRGRAIPFEGISD